MNPIHKLTLLTCLVCASALTAAPKAEKAPVQNPEEQPSTAQDQAAITALFQDYKEALSQKDGKRAAELISTDTAQIYEYYRQGALAGSKAEILKLPLVHQAGILILRGSIPPEDLINMSGKDVYASSIDNGLVANKWSAAMELMNIEFQDPHTAILSIGVKDQGGTRMPATKEANLWKLSLREVLLQSNAVIEKILTEKNIPQEQYLQSVIESQLGEGSYTKIWNPPATRIKKATTPDKKDQGVIWVEEPK